MQIGRNDRCPCGSGKKYKRCCGGRPGGRVTPRSEQGGSPEKRTLGAAIARVQALAAEKKEVLEELGVFLLYADQYGDAWLFEVTDSDCIQIASAGTVLEVPLEENEETIVVDWSHSFGFQKKKLQITDHHSRVQSILDNAPSQQLSAISKRILKRFSPEQLNQVHIVR